MPGSIHDHPASGFTVPVLMVALPEDLDVVNELLLHLPPTAHGRVVQEAADPGLADAVRPGPPDIVTHVLPPKEGHAPGASLCAALSGWVREWLLAEDEVEDAPGPHLVWVGAQHSPDLEALCRQLLTERFQLHLHHAGLR